MPKAVEDALRKAGKKKGYKDDRLQSFIYATMTNMQKKGSIPAWRKIKR